MIRSAGARANANIALIKYWGKKNEDLIIPMSSSLSLTLDALYTDSYISFRPDLEEDIFYLNGELADKSSSKRVTDFINLFRRDFNIKDKALIKSYNSFPTAAGLASSASGFAALAHACNLALGLNLTRKELSIYARKGSGSACRSIYGGFVEWKAGDSDKNSFARQLDRAEFDIGMIILVINSDRKKVSSRQAMKETVENSIFYKAYIDNNEKDMKSMKLYIKNKDIEAIGRLAERNSIRMHASMMGNSNPIIYLQEESIRFMGLVSEIRKSGIAAYYTMDAGPNVKIICRKSDMARIEKILSSYLDKDRIILSGVGSGVRQLEMNDIWI